MKVIIKETMDKSYYVGAMGDHIKWNRFDKRLPTKDDADRSDRIICVDSLGRPSFRYWDGSRRGQVWWAANVNYDVATIFDNLPMIPLALMDDPDPVRFRGIEIHL